MLACVRYANKFSHLNHLLYLGLVFQPMLQENAWRTREGEDIGIACLYVVVDRAAAWLTATAILCVVDLNKGDGIAVVLASEGH